MVEAKKEKEIVNIYFDLNLVNDLDDFIHNTRKQLPIHKKKKLNRTAIVTLILKEVFDEHAKFKQDSFLSKLISTWKDN